MKQALLEMAALVCPDDGAALRHADHGLLCKSCGREFSQTNGVWELLPLASLDEASPDGQRLESYRAGYSKRADRAWLQLGRVLIAELGNAYLYGWASGAIETVAAGRALRILDAACGEGMLWRHLSRRHDYVGSDFSARPLARASRYHPAEYFRADLNRLPFASDSFDLVVTLQALQYLENPQRAVDEVRRVLRPGGHFVWSVPNEESFKYRRLGVPANQLRRFRRETIAGLVSRGFHSLQLEARGLWLPLPRVSVHLPGHYSERHGLSWTGVAARNS
ncbi:MAG: methyltransferase domain-containing protein [Terriglobales bacterium]